jgi:hypothetical protein
MAPSPPGRVHAPKSPVLDVSTKTVLRVSSFMKRRKEDESLVPLLSGRKVRSMMLVGALSM